MKTIKEVLDFCVEFTLYGHYIIDRVVELNHDCDCVFSVLSKCDFTNEGKIYSVRCYRW